ncbi:MAG TPA: PRC-barrel domain-containing protein [Bacteroidales bacterium]|nr:PRC-barrel domain-containing protein [Bacteroidales bacterium]
MLTNSKDIVKYKLNAIDGEIGSIDEFYFDDRFWTVRYLVVNAGNWFNKKMVLISPYFLKNVDHKQEVINVDLTRDEIKNSPSVETDRPVSRQFEEAYYSYYGPPFYWGGPFVWGPLSTISHDRETWRTINTSKESWNPNLRSSDDVTDHNIHASDGDIGHVDDFIIDEESWTIRYMVIDTKNWLPGKKVLLSPQWVNNISWEELKVYVDLTREAIRNAPEYDNDNMITREYEIKLHDYYNRQGYWSEEPVSINYSDDEMRE